MAYENRAPIGRRVNDLLLIFGFLAISSYPAIALVMKRGESPTVASTENRLLARIPSFSLLMQRPHRFAKTFKAFFDDQFESRNQLVRLNSLVRYRLLRVCSNPAVIPGKHGTLFFAGDHTVVPKYDQGNELVNYRRIRPLTEYQLRRIADIVDRRRAWAASMGAKFLFVITPDKSTIYPELLPASLNRLSGPSPTDQIIDYLHHNTPVNLVDLRGELIEAKRHGPLYLARDTHWNAHGAFVGYQAVARKLRDLFPRIEPLSPNELTQSTIPYSGDLTKMLNLGELLEEEIALLTPMRPRSHPIPFPLDCRPVATWQAPPMATKIAGSKLPRALVYHDSMVYYMMPYLSEHFETAVYIRDLNVNLESVKNYHPDIVIHECLERMLQYYVDVVDDLRPERAERTIAAKGQRAGRS
jgi:alginate O-acetyltransferase complex protein AlgJ